MAIPSMVRRICRAERADRLPVVRVQARQLIEPIVDRRRFRHDPPEGVRRHAEATRHADAFDPRQPAQVRALAAHDRDLRLVDLLKIQHVLLVHCDTSEAAVLRRTAVADRITGDSNSVEPLVEHVLIPACLPSDESAGRSAPSAHAPHLRAEHPQPRCRSHHWFDVTASPYVDNNTRTSCPHFRRLWPRPTILRHAPGACGKPPSALYVESGKERVLLAFVFCRPMELATFSRSGGPPPRTDMRRWPRRMSHRPADATTGAAAEPEVVEVLFLVGEPGRRARTTSPGGRRTTRPLGTSRPPPPRCMKSRAASLRKASADRLAARACSVARSASPKLAAPPPYPWLPPASPQPTSNGPTTATCSRTPAPPAATSQRPPGRPHSRDQVRGQQPRLLLPLQRQPPPAPGRLPRKDRSGDRLPLAVALDADSRPASTRSSPPTPVRSHSTAEPTSSNVPNAVTQVSRSLPVTALAPNWHVTGRVSGLERSRQGEARGRSGDPSSRCLGPVALPLFPEAELVTTTGRCW